MRGSDSEAANQGKVMKRRSLQRGCYVKGSQTTSEQALPSGRTVHRRFGFFLGEVFSSGNDSFSSLVFPYFQDLSFNIKKEF